MCPRGSSHTLLEEKGHTGLNTTQPSSFQAPPFTPSATIMLGHCGTALFASLTHPQMHKEGWVWFCVFSPGMLVWVCSGLIRHMGSTCDWLSPSSSSFHLHHLSPQSSPLLFNTWLHYISWYVFCCETEVTWISSKHATHIYLKFSNYNAQIHFTVGLTNEKCSVIQSDWAINQEILSHRAIALSDSYCALSDCLTLRPSKSCVWALCKTVEQVPARWLFPLIITRRCSPLVCVPWNWIWQTSRCIAEIERDGVYSPQISPFVFPRVILSDLKMLLELRQNACKTLNIVKKIEQ